MNRVEPQSANSLPAARPGVRGGNGKFVFGLLVFYLAIEFIRPQSLVPVLGALRPALVTGAILIIYSLSQFSKPAYKDTGIRLLIVFTFLTVLSVPFATNNYHAFNAAQTMVLHAFAAVIPMVLLAIHLDRFRFLVGFWVAAHVYVAIYSLFHDGRGPGSFLADENDVALALNAALPLTYFLAQTTSIGRLRKIALLTASAVLVAAIVATASRGGFVGLAVTATAMIWFSRHRLRNMVLLGIAALIFWFSVPDTYREEIQSITDTSDGTRAERIRSWKLGWDMFLDNPILGVGARNYPWRVNDYQENAPSTRGLGGRAAHSLYFTLLPEYGLVGTLVFAWLLVNTIRKLRRTIRESVKSGLGEVSSFLEAVSRGYLVGLFGFLASAVFISVLYYPTFWMIAGFATIVAGLANQSLSGQEEDA